MKKFQPLTVTQVNINLAQLFDKKIGECRDIINPNQDALPIYRIRTDRAEFLVMEKMIFALLFKGTAADLTFLNEEGYIEHNQFRYYRWTNKTDIDQLLFACGYKKAKQVVDTDIIRLQRLAADAPIKWGIPGSMYVKFYKIIQDVKVLSATIEDRPDPIFKHKMERIITVQHSTGSFSFPIAPCCIDEVNDQVENIFRNLLQLPVSSAVAA